MLKRFMTSASSTPAGTPIRGMEFDGVFLGYVRLLDPQIRLIQRRTIPFGSGT
jgi:hypothetical protein